MAEFVYTAVFKAVSAVGATTLTASAIAGFASTYGLIIGGLALSATQAKRARRKARDQYNAQQVDRLVNTSSPVSPRMLVLGRARVGGAVFFKASTGTNRSTFVQCIALASHEIDALESVYFNDQAVTLDGSGNVTSAPYAVTTTESAWATGTGSAQNLAHTPIAGSVRAFTGTPGPEGDLTEVFASGSALTGAGTSITTTSGATIQYQYLRTSSNASVRLVQGTDTQVADARLQALFPGVWTSNHRALGVAYLVCEFSYSEASFPTGLPLVTALIRGAKVYDPRDNLCLYSEDFSDAVWAAYNTKRVTSNTHAGVDGSMTADTLTDLSAIQYEGVSYVRTVDDDAESHAFAIHVRKTSGATAPTFGFNLVLNGGGSPVNLTVRLNTDTGERAGTCPGDVEDAGAFWRVWGYITNNGSGNTFLYAQVWPALSAYGGGVADVVSTIGSAVIWGASWHAGVAISPYCRTTAAAAVAGTRWSENPALLMRHVYSHPSFGKATVTADEDARIVAAADACDTSTGYVVDGVTTTVALYRAATVAPFGTPARELLDDLAQAMAGSWAFAGGELYLKPGVWSASVLSLTEADLAVISRDGATEQMHPIELVVHRERTSLFNTVNLQIWDGQQDHKQVALAPVTDSALVARDGAALVQDVTLSAVAYAPQAQHVAAIMMRDARDPLTVTLPFKLKAYPVELFDTIDLTISRYGWSAKTFQVVGRNWSADGLLMLTLKESTASIFTLGASFLAQGGAANTSLPDPWYTPPLGTLTVTSGTGELVKLGDGTVATRVRVAWPAVSDSAVLQGGTIEVQYRSVSSTGAWSRVEVDGATADVVITDALDGDVLTIRARARTRLAVGDWGTQIVHTVLGKTEPPPPFDSFLVLVQPDGTRQFNFAYAASTTRPIDWRGAQIRYLAGSVIGPDWDDMTPLQDEQTFYTASPVELNQPGAGDWTFACRSMDTSGNLSTQLEQMITLNERRLGQTYDEYDELAEGWAGVLTGCFVNGMGEIEATDATTWDTAPATWAGWTRWNYAPTSPIYYETPARDMGAAIVGSITSSTDADGTETLELATSSDGTAWSAWGSASGTFSARYIKLRLSIAATVPEPVPLLRSWSWQVLAPLRTEYINDLVISGLTGSYRIGTGDIRIPLTGSFTALKRTEVTIQDSTAGTWAATRIDQTMTYGPRWQFRLNGVLTDPAFVDFYVEGY